MPKRNRCSAELWDAIKTAAASLEKRKIHYRLVGSAALAALGFDIEAEDGDFICGDEPSIGESQDGYGQRTVHIGGKKLDHIFFSDGRLNRFFATPAIDIDGVQVARPMVVLDLKRFANRAKDVEQLPAWRRIVEAA